MKRNIAYNTVLNAPSSEALSLPFYPLLPKDEVGLLKFRIYVMIRCLHDPEFREDTWNMCRLDVCFFATVFCWLHETRDDAFTRAAGKFPFIPWTDQVDILAWLQMHGGKRDMTIEKTRGIGLSWVAIIFIMWKWLTYGEHLDYGIISKDDMSLDMVGRPATLMGKLDVLFANLPGWMTIGSDGKSILHRTSTKHRFENRGNNNAILGFTASDDKLRSARLNLVIVDEAGFLPVDDQRWLAASQFVSSSRIFISTHDGTATFFYRMTQNTESRLVRIATWWQANPARSRGMYVVRAGQVVILDKDFKFPPGYDFVTTDPGLERSPWVDSEFQKPGIDHAQLMQEIYGTAAIHTRQLFQPRVLDTASQTAYPPNRICHLSEYDEFVDDLDGEWKLWQDEVLPFDGVYFVGVDPAIGVADRALAGIVVVDARTGQTVITAGLKETNCVDLARYVNVLCKLLCGPRSSGFAQVVPEVTGIGIAFLTELKRLRWTNIIKENKKLGIHNRDRGEKILIEAGRAIQDGDLVVSDIRIVDDYGHFEYNRKIELIFTGDVGHGDIGQAAALAWWGARVRRRAIQDAEQPPQEEELQPVEIDLLRRRPKNRSQWSKRFAVSL